MIDSRWITRFLLIVTAAGLLGGLGLRWAGYVSTADALWAVISVLALLPLLVDTVRQLLARQAGVDLIAILAMAGALSFGEYLTAAVVALMLSTGAALEQYAAGRAERELSALLRRAPQTAHRMDGTTLTDIPVTEVRAGDQLLIKEADSIPVDGTLLQPAMLDESALTGESRLVDRGIGDAVSSGVVNAGAPFQMRATATAEGSTYAGIIRLVESAQNAKSPFVRLADRYAAIFVPVTLVVAGAAWVASGDPVRALAVLVVATPCPLLLAAPIAIVSGISRAAQRGVIVRDGGALEALARTTTVFFDKTGTLTMGAPRLADIVVDGGRFEAPTVLRLAASVDQVSSHVLAAAVVRAAHERRVDLAMPTESVEVPGGGVQGVVDGRRVVVGSLRWVSSQLSQPANPDLQRRIMRHGGSHVVVAADGVLAGAVLLDDPIRPDTPRTLRALKRLGVRETVMVTGDREEAATAVGSAVGVDRVLAEQSPEAKVLAVAAARHDDDGTTAMIGDGINDAAALASADVGVAMGARGATASSEAADIVITVDRIDRLEEALRIAQRTRRIARESVLLGMLLSFVAMGAAAFGMLVPVAGALLQEGIDAAAILWALRALTPMRRPRMRGNVSLDLIRELRQEHRVIDAGVDRLREVADQLEGQDNAAVERLLDEARALIDDVLIPHEREDERRVYPLLGQAIRGDDPLGTLSRAHHELELQARQFSTLHQHLAAEGPTPGERQEFQRVLYGLHSILRLHNAQEEELFHELSDG
ncbi:MAG: heavy metal translocating P-type ATPase [Dehalococcoidia bacterium]